jgi:hypothetical protein
VAGPPDFELIAGLRARVLVSGVPPRARLKTEREDVALEHEDVRKNLPAEMRPRAKYRDVAVQKRVVGRLAAPCPRTGRGYNLGR